MRASTRNSPPHPSNLRRYDNNDNKKISSSSGSNQSQLLETCANRQGQHAAKTMAAPTCVYVDTRCCRCIFAALDSDKGITSLFCKNGELEFFRLEIDAKRAPEAKWVEIESVDRKAELQNMIKECHVRHQEKVREVKISVYGKEHIQEQEEKAAIKKNKRKRSRSRSSSSAKDK